MLTTSSSSSTRFSRSTWVRTLLNDGRIEKLQKKKAFFSSLAHCTLSLVTAPLLTLNTSLQMSVPKNVVTVKDFQAEISQADMANRARTSSLKGEKAPRFTAFLGMRNKQNLLKTNQAVGR